MTRSHSSPSGQMRCLREVLWSVGTASGSRSYEHKLEGGCSRHIVVASSSQ
jgi:hypothetical protein